MIAVGQKAPDFKLFRVKGEQVALESYRGRKLVVAFFPAAFTGVCEKELCTFRDAITLLDGMGADVVAISTDGAFANNAFAEKHQIKFPILSDYLKETIKAYGVEFPNFAGMPGYTAANRAVFVVDREGVVRYAWQGPHPGVEPSYDEVKAAVKAIA